MKGQSLIEILLSFALLTIVLTGIVISITSALSNATYAKNQAQASQYGQEGLEMIRGIRDSDYASFKGKSGNFCFGSDDTTLGSPTSACNTKNVGEFIRSVYIDQSGCGVNLAKVTITVAWRDGKCAAGSYCRKSNIVSCFSTVSPLQSP